MVFTIWAAMFEEWVADWFTESYYQNLRLHPINPPGPLKMGKNSIVRGGSWYLNRLITNTSSVASRTFYLPPSSQHDDLGFRCARSAP